MSQQFRAKVTEQLARVIEAAEGMAMATEDTRRNDCRERGIAAIFDLWRMLTGVSDQIGSRLLGLTLELIRRERPTLMMAGSTGDRLEEALEVILGTARRSWERSSTHPRQSSSSHSRASLKRLGTLLGLPISPESHYRLRMALGQVFPGDEIIEDYPLGPYCLEFYVPEYRLAFERLSDEPRPRPAESTFANSSLADGSLAKGYLAPLPNGPLPNDSLASDSRPHDSLANDSLLNDSLADGLSVESVVLKERHRKKEERCSAHGIILIAVPWDQSGNPASLLNLIRPRVHSDIFKRVIRVMGSPPPGIV